MRKADPSDGSSPFSEDHTFQHGSPHDPEAPGYPVYGVCPFQTEGQMNAHPVPGGGVLVQPMLIEPSYASSRANGENANAWSSPVIMDGQAKQCPSRIVRLFSNQKKYGISSSEQSPFQAPSNTPSTWSGLSNLRVAGSFKKLRSSVLQGIQNRGNVTAENQGGEGDLSTAANENGETVLVNNESHGHGSGHNHNNGTGVKSVSNGIARCEVNVGQGRDISDDEEEWNEEEVHLHRNSHFSRSIRRAYGHGRISLLDCGPKLQEVPLREHQVPRRRPCSTIDPVSPDMVETQQNVKALSRLSKSADNLHLFKSPFKRKVPTPAHEVSENLSQNIQRTASVSSMNIPERGVACRRSTARARDQMRKLVGSLTDLSVKRRASPGPSPRSPVSPLSQLHDDYSRRTPCIPASERQRRPSPMQVGTQSQHVQANVHEHTLSVHPAPSRPTFVDPSPSGNLDPLSPDPQLSSNCQRFQSTSSVSSSDAPNNHLVESYGIEENQKHGMDCYGFDQVLPSKSSGDEHTVDSIQVDLECVWKTPERDNEEQEATTEDPASCALHIGDDEKVCDSASVTPPATPSPTSPSNTLTTAVPRRRAGRNRPRPISDYGQLVSRKYSIPEERTELKSEEADYISHEDYSSNGTCVGSESEENRHANGQLENRRMRPVSVMGGLELFASPSLEEQESIDSLPSPVCRPPVPSHRMSPYRTVSVRLRPCVLSQSTPIGLDRVGRRKLHRILSDGNTEGCLALDDSVSEEDGSFDELTEGTPHLQPGVELSTLNECISSGHAVYAEALWDHVTMGDQELAFKVGDVIRVLDASEGDWWWGSVADREAWFPSSFVRVRVNQEDSGSEGVESVLDQNQEQSTPADAHTQITQHREQMRTNVVREIMDTERVYIKHLRDICEGYIRQCRKHPGMFTEDQLKTIFSNIEEIYKFQRSFLKDLEKKYNKEQPHLSEIGSCFLQQGEGFSIYSEYCNTHPAACAELQRLMKQSRYKHFFEACRLLQQMIDISIAGFLLTPVQKICKYPLQLGELLKYTPKAHSDYRGVCDAYEAMKNVASLINERKRRLESIDTIAHWQVSILNWEGEDVLARSSELIHSGELIRALRPGKTQQRSFFLFDHQLVFCKKDVLRRDLLHYRGRLDMDRAEVRELADGREPELGLSVKNGLLLRDAATREAWVLCCRKPRDRQRWLQAFGQERRRVQEDQEMGMEISEEQRKQAITNARKSKQGKIKSMNYAGHHAVPPHHQPLHPLHQRHVTVPTSIPQQQVFSLAEPKRKPSHLWYSFTRHALFRK